MPSATERRVSLQHNACGEGLRLEGRPPSKVAPDGLKTDPDVWAWGLADLTRMAREVSAALSALEADGPAVRWRLERAAAPLRMPEHLDIFSPTVVRSSRVCRLCHAVAGAVMDAIRHRNKTGEELANSVVELCVVTNVVAPHICNGLVRGNTVSLAALRHCRQSVRYQGTRHACRALFESGLGRVMEQPGARCEGSVVAIRRGKAALAVKGQGRPR